MFLDLDFFESFIVHKKNESLCVRNMYLFKKLASEIEEVKFNDIVLQVLERMIELRQQDELKQKHLKEFEIHNTKARRIAVFKKLLKEGLNFVISDRSMTVTVGESSMSCSKHEVIGSFIESLFPNRRMENLEKVRMKLVRKNSALKCSGGEGSLEISPRRIPIQEPEPEIMIASRGSRKNEDLANQEYIPSRRASLVKQEKIYPGYITEEGKTQAVLLQQSSKHLGQDHSKRRESALDRMEMRMSLQAFKEQEKYHS